MASAVLFDLDDTLHDRGAGVLASLARQHRERSLTRHGVELAAWQDRFCALERRGRVWKDVVYTELVREFGLPLASKDLLAEYELGFADHVVPRPELRTNLLRLKERGWKLGIVTNGRSVFQRRTLAALPIDDLLDAIVVSEECGLRKPDPAIFALALTACAANAETSWFVGDDPIADVQGAIDAGMRKIWFHPEGECAHLACVAARIGSP